jgi:hypothetical protein
MWVRISVFAPVARPGETDTRHECIQSPKNKHFYDLSDLLSPASSSERLGRSGVQTHAVHDEARERCAMGGSLRRIPRSRIAAARSADSIYEARSHSEAEWKTPSDVSSARSRLQNGTFRKPFV